METRKIEIGNDIDNNSVEMRIPARPEWVRVVRLATAGVAARLGFSYDEVEDLKLAVAEACNNAILHGNAGMSSTPNTPLPQVTIRWKISPDRLRISVSDEGRLNEGALPLLAKTSVPNELPEGGMGLILIQSLMDEVEHEFGPHADTTLHMTKFAPSVRLPASPPGSTPAPVVSETRRKTSPPSPAGARPAARTTQ